jgi:hypothetical protein
MVRIMSGGYKVTSALWANTFQKTKHEVRAQSLPEALGHREPRADQVPSERNLMNPNDPVSQENATLDRMINSICRGC